MNKNKPIYKLKNDYTNFRKDKLNYFKDKTIIFDNPLPIINSYDFSSNDKYFLDIRSLKRFKRKYSFNSKDLKNFISNDNANDYMIPKKIFSKGYLDISKYNITNSFYLNRTTVYYGCIVLVLNDKYICLLFENRAIKNLKILNNNFFKTKREEKLYLELNVSKFIF